MNTHVNIEVSLLSEDQRDKKEQKKQMKRDGMTPSKRRPTLVETALRTVHPLQPLSQHPTEFYRLSTTSYPLGNLRFGPKKNRQRKDTEMILFPSVNFNRN